MSAAMGGYAWNNGNTHYDDPNTTADPINFRPPTIVGPVTYIPTPSGTNGAGGLGGVGAGCNLQAQQWVYGIEGDFDWGRISGSQTTSGPGVLSEYQTGPTTHFGAIAPQANEQVSLNWLSTIRPRVGFAVTERFALFATGGRCPHLRNRIVYLGGAHNCLVFPERVTSSRSQHPAVRQWRHRWVFAWEGARRFASLVVRRYRSRSFAHRIGIKLRDRCLRQRPRKGFSLRRMGLRHPTAGRRRMTLVA